MEICTSNSNLITDGLVQPMVHAAEALATRRNQTIRAKKTCHRDAEEDHSNDLPVSAAIASPTATAKKLVHTQNDNFITFQNQLHQILDNDDHPSIISWLPHGRAFVIRDKVQLETVVQPMYFLNQSKYRSFVRRLQRWGFRRVLEGDDAGAYFHELFLKGRADLCKRMCCNPSASLSSNVSTIKATEKQKKKTHLSQDDGSHCSSNVSASSDSVFEPSATVETREDNEPSHSVAAVCVGPNTDRFRLMASQNTAELQALRRTLQMRNNEPIMQNNTFPLNHCIFPLRVNNTFNAVAMQSHELFYPISTMNQLRPLVVPNNAAITQGSVMVDRVICPINPNYSQHSALVILPDGEVSMVTPSFPRFSIIPRVIYFN